MLPLCIPNIPSSFFSPALSPLPARNIVLTYCDQRGGTNRVSALKHAHSNTVQKVKQGRALNVTSKTDNTEQSGRVYADQ